MFHKGHFSSEEKVNHNRSPSSEPCSCRDKTKGSSATSLGMCDKGGADQNGQAKDGCTYRDRVEITRLRPRRPNRDTVGFEECVLDPGGVWVPFLTKRVGCRWEISV